MKDNTLSSGSEVVGLLYSGGLDSAVVLGYLLAEGDIPFLINIDYGATQNFQENIAMQNVLSWYGVRGYTIRNYEAVIPNGVMFAEQVSRGIPDKKFDEMEENTTIYAGRNAVLISMAAAICISRNIRYLYAGMGAHDADDFPDCSEPFIRRMRGALAHGYELAFRTPLLIPPISRADAIRGAYASRVPLHLTYSCYRGTAEHCGACPTCYGRQESFQAAGFIDPTPYRKPFVQLLPIELEEWDVSNW